METFMQFVDQNYESQIFKLQRSMYMLLDPNVKINNNYLNHLLRHLTEDDTSLDPLKLKEEFFLEWFRCAVDTWTSSNIYIPRNVLIFSANLTSFLIKQEKFFIKLISTHILQEFIGIMRGIPEPVQFSQIKISYINMLLSILQHSSGVDWLMQTNYWFDVVTMASQVSQDELRQKSLSVLLHLLEESNRNNEVFCKKVIKTILTPIEDLAVSALKDKDTSLLDTSAMKETLNLVKNVLTGLLKSSSKSGNFSVLSNFVEQNYLEKNLYDILSVVEKESSLILLNTILCLVLFCNLTMSFRKCLSLQTHVIVQKIANLIIDVVVKCKPYYKLFTIIESCFMLGKYIFDITTEHDKCKIAKMEIFQNQLLIYLMWPLFDCAKKINKDRMKINEADEFRENFVSKVIRNIHSDTHMNLRRLRAAVNTFTLEDTVKNLEYIQICLPFIQHNVANTITQILIYTFSDMLTTMDTIQDTFFWPQDFFGIYIDTLVLLLRTFDLTWKDSVETVYVTDIAIRVLGQRFWGPKLITKGLELLDVAISKCLSPNMAFLLNDETDSQIKILEDIILNNIRSESWEIRCMTLQIVGTIARKAREKFDSYEKMLIQARLPTLVLNMAMNDLNCQVRVKVLQCLQEIIRVEELWCYLIKAENIYEQLLKYFYLQEEGIVRSEGLVLLKIIFEIHKIPEMFEEKIYDCMVYAILQDEHQLVKLKALSFWDLVVKKQLEHEGMIDGKFPTVTFSKVLRKIITFDDATVERCLLRVLHRLNEIGGLYVFIHIFQNENDDELVNPAIKYIDKFVQLLIKYNITFSSYIDSEYACHPSSGGNHFQETPPDDFLNELLDLETNNIIRYPKERMSTERKNKQIDFWEFLKVFDDFCNKRARKNGSGDDLDTVLTKLFVE